MDDESIFLETPGVRSVKINQAVQATPQTFETASYTGNELMITFMSTQGEMAFKKAQNQLVLDRAMEEEFKMTLEIFDEFAN